MYTRFSSQGRPVPPFHFTTGTGPMTRDTANVGVYYRKWNGLDSTGAPQQASTIVVRGIDKKAVPTIGARAFQKFRPRSYLICTHGVVVVPWQ